MQIQELLHKAISKPVGSEDYRDYKTILFKECERELQNFEPLSIGETTANPIQLLDFFSGAGGTSLGFATINRLYPVFRFLGGCDINSISAASYSKNYGTPLINEDILKISKNKDSIRSFLESIDFDPKLPTILIGCAPCQGFSSHRKTRWDEEDDDRNNLVVAFSRIVSEVNPAVFIMENVPEFLSNKYWKYFSKARSIFLNAGYTVKQHIHNAAEFGVPQARFRSIVIGMKKEFLLPEGIYTPDSFKTVRDAISSLSTIAAGETSHEDWMHKAVAHKPSTLEIIRKVPHDGGKLPQGIGPESLTRIKGFSDVYGRLSWDKPSITITHYARNPASGRFTHPVQDRGITAREAARLQSFPDGFKFEGKFDDIYRQIGEAVPPLMSCGIASSVLIELLSCEPTEAQLSAGIQPKDLPVSNSYSNVISDVKVKRGGKNAVNLC